MKRRLLFVLPFLLVTSAQAAKPQTVGYVNMQKVLDESRRGRQAHQTLQEKFEGKQRGLAEEQQSIRQLQEILDRDKPLMSQEQLDKKTAEIQGRKKGLQKKLEQFQKELAQEENKLTNQILEPAPAIIATVAQDKKVFIVFDHRKSGFLYIDKDLDLANEGLDLTAEVIKRLNAKK